MRRNGGIEAVCFGSCMYTCSGRDEGWPLSLHVLGVLCMIFRYMGDSIGISISIGVGGGLGGYVKLIGLQVIILWRRVRNC